MAAEWEMPRVELPPQPLLFQLAIWMHVVQQRARTFPLQFDKDLLSLMGTKNLQGLDNVVSTLSSLSTKDLPRERALDMDAMDCVGSDQDGEGEPDLGVV